MTPGREFIFSYMMNKNSVSFDGTSVIIKRGAFHKTTFPFHSINNWYVYEEKTYRSLFFTYTNEAGKAKKIQLISQLGDIGFRDLVEELNMSIGAKGLNHLTQKEAFQVMKATNPKKMGALAAMIIILALTTTCMLPGLLHYFDFGFEDADVEQLIAGEDLGTRNLNLWGIPLEETLEETNSKNGSTTSVKYFIPIVGADWDYDQPVEVIMLLDNASEDEFYELYDEVEFKGVVRNIWYEGMDQDEIDFFGSEYGLDVSDDVITFEVTGEEHNDSMMFFVWCFINGLFIIIFGIVYLKNR